MTLILNLLVWVVLCIGVLAWWKTKKHWLLVATFAALVIYMQAQPSYMPKSEIQRPPPQEFTESDAPIEDRNSKPASLETRDQRIKEAVANGLDFKN